jgi:Fe-S cluster assembly protein SufD
MTALEAAREHYLARSEDFRRAQGSEPGWLAALRADALAAFGESGLPSTRLEEWRYTNVTPLAKIPFEVAARGHSVSREALESLAFPLFACSLYVFVNGRYAPEFSAPLANPDASWIESIAALRARSPERLEPYLGRCIDVKGHPFAALNSAFLDDGAFVYVPRAAEAGQPIHLVFVATEAERHAVVHPRVLIAAERGSRVTVIQDHICLGESAGFTNAVTEVHAGAGSEVNLVLVQREHDHHFHVSNLQVQQERDARFASHTLTLGGALVRNDAAALLADEARRQPHSHRPRRPPLHQPRALQGRAGRALAGRVPRARDRAAGRPADERRAVESKRVAEPRRRGEHEAAARDLRRRREVQSRHQHRTARRRCALLPAVARPR